MAIAKKLPSGTWRVRLYIGQVDGKSKYKSFTAATKREAERMAATYTAINSHDELTFGEAAERYIESKANVLSPNTIRGYKVITYRLGRLSPVRMSKLDSEKVQKVINNLSNTLSPKTVRNTYGFITAVVKMFRPSTILNVSLPEPEHKETLIPTAEEVRLMIQSAHSDDLRIAIQLAAFCSLRSGEACALMHDMVQKNHVRVARTLVLNDQGQWVMKQSPKTLAGYRDIPVPGPLMAQIRASKHEDGRILKYTPTSLRSALNRLTKHLGLPQYKFHSLRHYFATSCHGQGIPDKVIAKLGGWEDIGTLQKIYQHATKAKMDEASVILDNLYAETMTQIMTRPRLEVLKDA